MKSCISATVASIILLASSTSAFAWNLEARYINALRFEKGGTILFTLFDSGVSGPEFICDETLDFGDRGKQWFQISSCNKGKGSKGKDNNSASSTCLSSVDRMAEMLLKAKLEGVPVHVTRETNPFGCGVTETALKPL